MPGFGAVARSSAERCSHRGSSAGMPSSSLACLRSSRSDKTSSSSHFNKSSREPGSWHTVHLAVSEQIKPAITWHLPIYLQHSCNSVTPGTPAHPLYSTHSMPRALEPGRSARDSRGPHHPSTMRPPRARESQPSPDELRLSPLQMPGLREGGGAGVDPRVWDGGIGLVCNCCLSSQLPFSSCTSGPAITQALYLLSPDLPLCRVLDLLLLDGDGVLDLLHVPRGGDRCRVAASRGFKGGIPVGKVLQYHCRQSRVVRHRPYPPQSSLTSASPPR